jgi:hypothetical protein
MITAGCAIAGAGRIALAKPRYADRIVRAFLKVEQANYQTPECRNVALGHDVKSLDLFIEHIGNPEPVLAFVRRQLDNTRNAVRKKAAAFLRKHSGSKLYSGRLSRDCQAAAGIPESPGSGVVGAKSGSKSISIPKWNPVSSS